MKLIIFCVNIFTITTSKYYKNDAIKLHFDDAFIDDIFIDAAISDMNYFYLDTYVG